MTTTLSSRPQQAPTRPRRSNRGTLRARTRPQHATYRLAFSSSSPPQAAFVEVYCGAGGEVERVERNSEGLFYQVGALSHLFERHDECNRRYSRASWACRSRCGVSGTLSVVRACSC